MVAKAVMIITGVPGRAELVMWKTYELPITVLSAAIARAGLGSGWTLGPHHALVTGTQSVLVRGDGSQRRVYEDQDVVWTIAGTGAYGYYGRYPFRDQLTHNGRNAFQCDGETAGIR